MQRDHRSERRQRRKAPIEVGGNEFREAGYALVDEIANYLDTIRQRPVTTGKAPEAIRAILGNGSLPESGAELKRMVNEATRLVSNHSLFNGHPRFMGYITSWEDLEALMAVVGRVGKKHVAILRPQSLKSA